jgi:hypothetical protein
MVMNEKITNVLNQLIDIELDASNQKHGRLNSIHEWYAVILEEIEEVYENIDCLNQYRGKIWTKIKKDEEITEIDLNRFDIIVLQTLNELLQVGTMIKKIRPLIKQAPKQVPFENKHGNMYSNNTGQVNICNGNSNLNATQEINYEKGK